MTIPPKKSLRCTFLIACHAKWLIQMMGYTQSQAAELGQHHHISGKYLLAYTCEMAWKEDNRRVANGTQHEAVTALALAHPVSRVWAGYWQR